MRRLICFIAVLVLVFVGTLSVQAAPGGQGKDKSQCASVQDGTLLNAVGEPITSGFSLWGYNYGAYQFNGTYCEAQYVGESECPEAEAGIELVMRWNDAWLSSWDCDHDGELDRHRGWPSYRNSGAALTNIMSGVDENGNKWRYEVDIVAVPRASFLFNGAWYDHDGKQIGPAIWGEFAIIKERISGDAHRGWEVLYKSEDSSGLGSHKNWPQ